MDAFARTTDEVLSLEEFRALLATGRRLKVKFGADVTAPFLHLGHAVNLWMMREMQERGHLVQFLIGDFTTLIGDPTGRGEGRKQRSTDEISADAESFIRQAGKILITDDSRVFEVRRNSQWWEAKPLSAFIELLGSVTVTKLLSRDMFRARLESGGEVRTHELVYPLLQGWDSVELGSDLTIVGSDQLFNESMGRFFQEREGQAPQVIISSRITPGLDGVRKQSKSLNNFVSLDDGPRDVFGKVMSLPDKLIVQWLEVYTQLPASRVLEIADSLAADRCNPRDAKLELASAIVSRLHGAQAAALEASWFLSVVAGREFPPDAPLVELPQRSWLALELLVCLDPAVSRGELRRIIEGGGVELDGVRIVSADERIVLRDGSPMHLKLGRRRFFRIMPCERSFEYSTGPCGFGC